MTSSFTLVLATAGLVAGVAGTVALAPDHDQRTLTLAVLDYESGIWTQQLISESGKPIKGDWYVQVSRNENGALRVLCEGGGSGSYNGEVSNYVTNDWVGASCPDLIPGDIVKPMWEYKNQHGILTSVGTIYTIQD